MTISGVYGELSKKVKYLLSSISMSKNAVLMPVVRGQGTRLFWTDRKATATQITNLYNQTISEHSTWDQMDQSVCRSSQLRTGNWGYKQVHQNRTRKDGPMSLCVIQMIQSESGINNTKARVQCAFKDSGCCHNGVDILVPIWMLQTLWLLLLTMSINLWPQCTRLLMAEHLSSHFLIQISNFSLSHLARGSTAVQWLVRSPQSKDTGSNLLCVEFASSLCAAKRNAWFCVWRSHYQYMYMGKGI